MDILRVLFVVNIIMTGIMLWLTVGTGIRKAKQWSAETDVPVWFIMTCLVIMGIAWPVTLWHFWKFAWNKEEE